MYKKSITALENMAKVKINYADGCLRAVAQYIGLPKKYSLIVASEVEGSTNAYQIYWYLNEILSAVSEDKELSIKQKLKMEEDIAKAIYLKWSDFDHPFEWA